MVGVAEKLDRYASVILLFIAMGLWFNVFLYLFYTDMIVESIEGEIVKLIEEKGVTAKVSGTMYCTSGNVTIVKAPGGGGGLDEMWLILLAGLFLAFVVRDILRG